jgi:hypothetical protein
MSTHFTPRAAPAAAVLGRKLHVCQCVDHSNGFAAMVQRTAHSINIPVLFQQINGVHLPEAVGRHILWQPESLGGTLDIFPDRLPGVVLPGIPARKYPDFPGMVLQIRQQRLW